MILWSGCYCQPLVSNFIAWLKSKFWLEFKCFLFCCFMYCQRKPIRKIIINTIISNDLTLIVFLIFHFFFFFLEGKGYVSHSSGCTQQLNIKRLVPIEWCKMLVEGLTLRFLDVFCLFVVIFFLKRLAFLFSVYEAFSDCQKEFK